MGKKELRVPHDRLRDPQTITGEQRRAFAERGLDFLRDEVVRHEDDHDRGERVYSVRARRTFVDLGKGRR